MSTSFWKDKWRSNIPFCDIFPRLFAISRQKEGCEGRLVLIWKVREDGVFCGVEISVWETKLLQNLLGMLEGMVLEEGSGDGGWRMKEVFSELVP